MSQLTLGSQAFKGQMQGAFLPRHLTCPKKTRLRFVIVAQQRSKKKSKAEQSQKDAYDSYKQQQMGEQKPPRVDVDPEVEEFVIFFRTKQVPTWNPYSIMKSGNVGKIMVRSAQQIESYKQSWLKPVCAWIMDNIQNQVATSIYKDEDRIVDELKSSPRVPDSIQKEDFQWGWRIRDKEDPDNWYKPKGVKRVPPKDKVRKGFVTNVQDGWKGFTSSVGETRQKIRRKLRGLPEPEPFKPEN